MMDIYLVILFVSLYCCLHYIFWGKDLNYPKMSDKVRTNQTKKPMATKVKHG